MWTACQVLGPSCPSGRTDPVAARLTHPELRGFASRPRGRFAFSTLVLARSVSARPCPDLTPAEAHFVHAASLGPMLGRRLLVLFAVLLGLTALATSLAPRPRSATAGLHASDALRPPRRPRRSAPPPPRAGSSRRSRPIPAARGRACAPGSATSSSSPSRATCSTASRSPQLGKLEPIEPGSPALLRDAARDAGRAPRRTGRREALIGLVEVWPARQARGTGLSGAGPARSSGSRASWRRSARGSTAGCGSAAGRRSCSPC